MVCYITKEGKILEGKTHEEIPNSALYETQLPETRMIKYTTCVNNGKWIGLRRATPKQEKAIVDFCLKYNLPIPFDFDEDGYPK